VSIHHPFHRAPLSADDAKLTLIAMKHCGIRSLRETGDEFYDFPLVRLSQLHAALKAAKALGEMNRRMG
jgi:hypothetical protein